MVTFRAGREILRSCTRASTRWCPQVPILAEPGKATAVPELPAAPFALYVYRGDGRRSYRALIRSLLAAFPSDVGHVVVALHRPSAARWVPRNIPRRLVSRLSLVEFDTAQELSAVYRAAAVTILPFLGGEWTMATAAEAVVQGSPLVGPDLPVVRDCLGLAAGRSAGVERRGVLAG